jgi:hypothetical protein
VATFSTAPGYNNYNQYCQTVQIDRDEDDILLAQDAGIVSDDDDDNGANTPHQNTHPTPIPINNE